VGDAQVDLSFTRGKEGKIEVEIMDLEGELDVQIREG
jgi:hypothetical protein